MASASRWVSPSSPPEAISTGTAGSAFGIDGTDTAEQPPQIANNVSAKNVLTG
jgi:hypothetical protein